MDRSTRTILWIWLVALVVGGGTYAILRTVTSREIAFALALFLYAAAGWPGFRILAARNGHALSPVVYFLAFGIASLVLLFV